MISNKNSVPYEDWEALIEFIKYDKKVTNKKKFYPSVKEIDISLVIALFNLSMCFKQHAIENIFLS